MSSEEISELKLASALPMIYEQFLGYTYDGVVIVLAPQDSGDISFK